MFLSKYECFEHKKTKKAHFSILFNAPNRISLTLTRPPLPIFRNFAP